MDSQSDWKTALRCRPWIAALTTAIIAAPIAIAWTYLDFMFEAFGMPAIPFVIVTAVTYEVFVAAPLLLLARKATGGLTWYTIAAAHLPGALIAAFFVAGVLLYAGSM